MTIVGLDQNRIIDAIFINSPLKNYDQTPRYNDFTLPVLGLAYIATYAKKQGLNVGVLDSEALGLGISRVTNIVNVAKPRWVGLNLLAPTYTHSVEILQNLSRDILVMLGGHQAKAMPVDIIQDYQIPRIDAMILGEGEYRAAAILADVKRRKDLPNIWWRDEYQKPQHSELILLANSNDWLIPDIDTLPFVDREFLAQDPFMTKAGRIEANMIGSRGCPYDCSFCSAAISNNRDISVRTRNPNNIVNEMEDVFQKYNAAAFRFVDDLFLASVPFMRQCLPLFKSRNIGNRYVWDATGRINVLSRISDDMLDLMVDTGCREVSLGIESGNERVLNYMGKRITPKMTRDVVYKLTKHGISIKGYFILGFPTETQVELEDTIKHIQELWDISDKEPGNFRCSTFEFRPYPGTPEWQRLISSGKYTSAQLLRYNQVDLTHKGSISEMLDRDEFNFSVNIQFGETPIEMVRQYVTEIMVEQKQRLLSAM